MENSTCATAVLLTPVQLKRIEFAGGRGEILRRAYDGTGGRANAVKAKCLECVNFEDAVNTIRDCTVMTCPLRPYRPYQTGAEE